VRQLSTLLAGTPPLRAISTMRHVYFTDVPLSIGALGGALVAPLSQETAPSCVCSRDVPEIGA
jgi:hypothetical protein